MSVEAPMDAPVVAPVGSARAAIAAALASAAAAWTAGGLFSGIAARGVALLGVAIGVGLIAWSARARRPAAVQYLVLPVAALVGAILVLPDTGGADTLTSLIAEAVRSGGLAQAPVPFDPGWRFLLVLVMAVLSAAAASLAIGLDRPKLAVSLPVPVVVAAAVVLPAGSEIVSSVVAIGLLLASLAVAYGSELAAPGEGGRGFETRRLGRGAVLVAVLAVVIGGLSRASALFPERSSDRVVPAQRPPAGTPLGDRVLFRVTSEIPGPWRLGVLDGYDGTGWLLPPFDPATLRDVDGPIGDAEASQTVTATFTIGDLPGRTLPGLASPLRVEGLTARAQYDPRTQILRLPDTRADEGLTYTVTAPVTPTGRALADAPAPPEGLAPFLAVPQAPNEVVSLLADAPRNAWDRLVYVRAALYQKVVAAGAGVPQDVPPARVAAMLKGGQATPFEITAAEALLARWAGVPSRIGFGFYSGDTVDGAFEVHPRHGATWLEVYFDGLGWVPIVGVPPRARATLTPDQQQENPNVEATDELAMVVYVPVRLRSVRLLYVTIRYWLGVALPPIMVLLLLWWLVPGLAKAARAMRRRRWGAARGPAGRILVAYAGLRDAATDLGIDGRADTPLEFLDALAADDEHTELAWLVSRALWGDLRRDLNEQDAVAAETLARSVTRRLRRGHNGLARAMAFGSRRSIREPYDAAMPRAWRPRRALAAGIAVLILVLTSCAAPAVDERAVPGTLPERIVPRALGALRIAREPTAEDAFVQAGDTSLLHDGRVFTIRDGSTVQGYVEAASFVGGIDVRDPEVRDGVLRSIAAGRFRLQRIGDERVWVQSLPEQRMLLTFAPDGGSMTLLVARRAFAEADQTFLDIVAYQRGDAPGAREVLAPAYDPRRGEQR